MSLVPPLGDKRHAGRLINLSALWTTITFIVVIPLSQLRRCHQLRFNYFTCSPETHPYQMDVLWKINRLLLACPPPPLALRQQIFQVLLRLTQASVGRGSKFESLP